MATPLKRQPEQEEHYLKTELDQLVTQNRVWNFLRAGSLDGVWYWDIENTEHEWMSPEFWELFGIDPATKTHDPAEWQDLINPDDLQLAMDNFQEHCANPNHPYDQIVRYRHADGSTVWVRCRGLAIRDETGRPIRMLGAHNDVTPLKLAEESARRERELADAATDELRTFTYAIGHDLKSPANTVRILLGEVRHALGQGDIPDAIDLLEKAESTIDGMRQMVDDLLTYTQLIDSETEMKRIDLDAKLAKVLELLAADIDATGAKITIGPCGHVTGCDWQLRALFQNLISNAIKFREPGTHPHIQVSAEKSGGGRTRVTVTDDGIGIPTHDQNRVFDLFSKLHRASEYTGSGIGLALCQRVAQNHGAAIEIRSTPGTGTSLTVSLPTSPD